MKFILSTLVIFLTSCSSELREPEFYYRGDFDVELVDRVDAYFKALADSNRVEVFEKDRREMKAITQGMDAFYISFYIGDSRTPILWVTNSGSGTVLDLSLHSNEAYPLNETRKLAVLVVGDLKKLFGIDMVSVK